MKRLFVITLESIVLANRSFAVAIGYFNDRKQYFICRTKCFS